MSTLSSTLIAIFLVGLFFSGFFSMLEAAVISQDRHRLRYRVEHGDKNALIMHDLLFEHTERVLAAILLCNNLANVTCATAATALFTKLFNDHESVLLIVTLLVTFIILVFSEITPKVIGVRHAERIAIFCARLLRVLLWVLSPFVGVANWLSSGLLFLIGIRHRTGLQTVMNISELRTAVRAASRADNDETSQHYYMLEKTLSFNEIPVEKIMTPRRDMIGINLKTSPQEIAEMVIKADYAKLPLYEDSLDDIKGTVDTIHALKEIRDGIVSAAALLAIAKPPFYVPAAANAMQQMQLLRKDSQRIAYVADGGGRIIGMLTFANFAAAIIGDEKSPDDAHGVDGVWDVSANMSLMKLGRLDPSLSLPDNVSATTLNGLILEHFGDLPDNLMCLIIHGWRLEITELDDKSVLRIRIHPPATKTAH